MAGSVVEFEARGVWRAAVALIARVSDRAPERSIVCLRGAVRWGTRSARTVVLYYCTRTTYLLKSSVLRYLMYSAVFIFLDILIS